jgi:hypothetical protein
MDFKFQGKAENGSIKFKERGNVVRFLESIDGKNITVTIKEVKQVRSLGWNSYYWTVVIPRVKIGLNDMGYEADELDNEIVHGVLTERFLSKKIYSEFLEESLTIQERTSKISNADFKAFVERIQRWAMEFLHVYIPDPNEGMGLGEKE